MENNGSVTIAVNDFIHSLYAYKNISLYDANHVFDEEKSVRWNREEVERLNNSTTGLAKPIHRLVRKLLL